MRTENNDSDNEEIYLIFFLLSFFWGQNKGCQFRNEWLGLCSFPSSTMREQRRKCPKKIKDAISICFSFS